MTLRSIYRCDTSHVVDMASQLIGSQPFTCDAAGQATQVKQIMRLPSRDLAHGMKRGYTSILRNFQIGLVIRRRTGCGRTSSSRAHRDILGIYAWWQTLRRGFIMLNIDSRPFTYPGLLVLHPHKIKPPRRVAPEFTLPVQKWTRKIFTNSYLLTGS